MPTVDPRDRGFRQDPTTGRYTLAPGEPSETVHHCHAPGCPVPVPPKMFMCRPHWFRLPKPMRDAVWKHYRPGQEERKVPVSKEYLRVTAEAEAFIAALEAPRGTA